MNRLDWVIVRRLFGSVGLTLAIFFGIVVLVESTNVDRFNTLLGVGGLPLALAGVVGAAARFVVDTLPLTLLVGAVAGLLNLQATREMTVIKAAGVSVWRLMQAPLAATALCGLLVALAIDTGVVILNRTISPLASSGTTGTQRLWLDERGTDQRYMLEAGYGTAGGDSLSDVTVFFTLAPRDRIEAPAAQLVDGNWVMPEATRYRSNGLADQLTDYRLESSQTVADMQARFSSVPDTTVWELATSLSMRMTDRQERAEIEMRFLRLIGLPLTLCGSLVIAFAFTAGYRRTNKYGGAVLYGIVLGSLVYVVTELAGRAGSAGIVHPAIAVAGPAAVAVIVGVTVLLNREDGRT